MLFGLTGDYVGSIGDLGLRRIGVGPQLERNSPHIFMVARWLHLGWAQTRVASPHDHHYHIFVNLVVIRRVAHVPCILRAENF